MSRRFCRFCGVELNKQNAYKNSNNKRKLKLICKNCDNKQRLARIEKNGKIYRIKVRVGITRSHLIEFSSFALKNSFRVLRRLQIRWGRCHSSRSSNFNQRVEEIIEERQEDGTIHRFYRAAACSACHSEIRYDEHGYKVCSNCGLIRDDLVLPESHAENKFSHDSRAQTYLGWDHGWEDERPPDERYSTYDRYYAAAYSKRRK